MIKPSIALPLVAAMALAACDPAAGVVTSRAGLPDPALATAPTPYGPRQGSESQVAALAARIGALGPGIDPAEARAAAELAYATTARLATEYRITDGPLVHNTKVNLGLKPRGLCYDWADDLQAAFRAAGFRTLELHRAIANSENPFRLEHSTLVVSAPGQEMRQGMVLDPWRRGGWLHWVEVADDHDYKWIPRAEVFAKKRKLAGLGE